MTSIQPEMNTDGCADSPGYMIPEPERPLAFDNALYGHVDEPADTFRTGSIEIKPGRHDGLRFADETGELYQIVGIEEDPENPGEYVLGNLVSASAEGGQAEPKRVRLQRRVRESWPYQYFLVDHKREATVAISISAVAVASLVVRRRNKS